MFDESFWKFISDNINENPDKLRLKYHKASNLGFDVNFAILQIECRKKYKKKFADMLAASDRFLFPSCLACEQATSDRLAEQHAKMIGSVNALADLTSGLGIDVFHAAKYAKTVTAVEIDHVKAEILRHNASVLGFDNINVVEHDCCVFVRNCSAGQFDVVFIDPARRSSDGGRVYALADCQPDIVALQPEVFKVSKRLVVKMSPMLDITQVGRELEGCCQIITLGTTTECKDVVAIAQLGYEGEMSLKSETIMSDSVLSFTTTRGAAATAGYGLPAVGDTLCEPYPPIMKLGCWGALSARFGLCQISQNTHIYFAQGDDVATEAKNAFSFHNVIEVLPYQSKVIKRLKSKYPRISVTCRNFGTTADVLRGKLGVKDGGDYRLFAVTDVEANPYLIIVRPI